ncbi:hypothetical protein ACFYTC_19255 [Actinomadura nitritigenes]|uniref:hypothetical protein n=1 Tax=Actinomadura nitritigenes TaxID=134602 RepID=UPI0036D1D3DD
MINADKRLNVIVRNPNGSYQPGKFAALANRVARPRVGEVGAISVVGASTRGVAYRRVTPETPIDLSDEGTGAVVRRPCRCTRSPVPFSTELTGRSLSHG